MDFLLSPDWLNRPGPYGFKLDHLLSVFILMCLGILLAIFLRKKNQKVVHITLTILWAIATFLEMGYLITRWVICIIDPINNPFLIDYMLPLHSCFMFMFVCPFALFSKNKYLKTASSNFLVVVNMIMGFITLFVGCPAKGYSALSFAGSISIIYHALIVIVPLIMLVTKYYDIQKGDIKFGLILFGVLAFFIWIFDAITKCDYFYIYDGHAFGILYEISENVPHIVWTLLIVTCYVLTALIIHYSVIYIKYLINKKKEQ